MNTYTNNELRERLLECDYPNETKLLEDVIDKIRNFGPDAEQMFSTWYKTGQISDFNINEITPTYLRKYHKMKDVGVIIAYDWLNKNSKEAAYLLKKPIILHHQFNPKHI